VQLPSCTTRFLLVDDKVFFVYNDGSLLLKQNWLLEPAELDVVTAARLQLRAETSWRRRAAPSPSPAAANLEGNKGAKPADKETNNGRAAETKADTSTNTSAVTGTTARPAAGGRAESAAGQSAKDKQ
jgi:hypothetical protein